MSDESDHMAAEYVLGTLSFADREAARRRMDVDPGFAAAVRDWENRLAPLDDATEPVDPPPAVWGRIAAAVAVAEDPARPWRQDEDPQRLRRRLAFWRRGALAAVAVAAGLAGVIVLSATGILVWTGERPRYAAVVNADGGLPALLIEIDTASEQIEVRVFDAEQPVGGSLELWSVPEGAAPRSLGIIGPQRLLRVAAEKAGDLTGNTVFAVSVEPPGGSPTGAPTGPVIYSGQLVRLD